jgi:hypothetical protein
MRPDSAVRQQLLGNGRACALFLFAGEFEEDFFKGVVGTSALAADFVECPEGDEFAVVDDADAVGQFLGDAQRVGGEEDGGAVARAFFQRVFDDAGVTRVKADHRFVDDDDFGLMEEGGEIGRASCRERVSLHV